jgi:hypothetical protein
MQHLQRLQAQTRDDRYAVNAATLVEPSDGNYDYADPTYATNDPDTWTHTAWGETDYDDGYADPAGYALPCTQVSSHDYLQDIAAAEETQYDHYATLSGVKRSDRT